MAIELKDKEADRLAIYYLAYRGDGKRAIDAYAEAKKLIEETDSLSDGSMIAQNLLSNLLPIAVATGIVINALKCFTGYIEGGLWITSPTGKTTIQFHYKLAMRIIRKRGWRFAKVEPVKAKRVISRREALEILLHGNTP